MRSTRSRRTTTSAWWPSPSWPTSEGNTATPSSRTKRLVLVACILGSTVVTVDGTVVNVALPAIADDLGGGLAGQQWTSNAYLVTLASLLLIGGSLGDIFGERRVFVVGVAAFGATSLLCAVAPTIEVLVVARALQGVAGALLTPAALAVIVANFGPEERGRAVGAWTAWGGIGVMLGPLVGGQLVDAASWRWIFAINVPLVLGTIVLILRVVPPGEREGRAAVDVVGATLCALGLAGMTFGLIEQPLRGWDDPAVFLALGIGALLFACFLLWERRAPAPMLPLGLFRRRNFAIGNVQTFAMYAGLGLLFFFLVLFLQQVAGYEAIEAGAVSLPVTAVMFLLSTRFGGLADRQGPPAGGGAGRGGGKAPAPCHRRGERFAAGAGAQGGGRRPRRLGERLPARDGHRGRAGGAGGIARAGWDRQSAAPRVGP